MLRTTGSINKLMKTPSATWVHLTMTLLWVVLIIPTILWWRESVTWVSLMSIYAIIVGHWASYQAAHAEEKLECKVDEAIQAEPPNQEEQP